MDADLLYQQLAEGSSEPVDLSWARRQLQRKALASASDPDPAVRLGALRVAAVLGPETGLAVVAPLMRDPDRAVRTWAFNQAVAARADGIPLLRDAAEGPDPELSAVALELLLLRCDLASANVARRLTRSDDARLRELAARLLGEVGGGGMRADLLRLTSDPIPAVRDAAAQANSRLMGDLPKSKPDQWWSDPPAADGAEAPAADPVVLPVPPSGVVPAALPAEVTSRLSRPAAAPPAPPAAAEPVSGEPQAAGPVAGEPQSAGPEAGEPKGDKKKKTKTKADAAPADGEADADPAAVASPSPPSDTALVPASETAVAAPEADADLPPKDGAYAPLPAKLPSEPRALARLLGMVSPDDRGAVCDALGVVSDELAKLWGDWSSGGDAALGRGLCIYGAQRGLSAWLSKARSLLQDGQPGVRGGAALLVGAQGGIGVLPALQRLLGDVDPGVRADAALGVADLAVRSARADHAKGLLAALDKDTDPGVVAALALARVRLG